MSRGRHPAMHVALASIHKIDYLVTWNFGHLANVRKQARIRVFNVSAGFFVPMIVTPLCSMTSRSPVRPSSPRADAV